MGQPRASRRRRALPSSDDESAGADSTSQDVQSGDSSVAGRVDPEQSSTPSSTTVKAPSQKSPIKAKASKSKATPAAKDPPTRSAKPIYSFFNAATSRQQASQERRSPEKVLTPPQEVEVINDASDDDGLVTVSESSSTALALRKRKLQQLDGGQGPASSYPGSQKFRKINETSRTPAIAIVNTDKRPWTEQFAPADLTELCVHKRKVADVREWLSSAYNGRRRRILVLKGPTGVGKSTTIRLLAQEMGVQLSEWKNPDSTQIQGEGLNSISQFEEFLHRAGRLHGLAFVGESNTSTHFPDNAASFSNSDSNSKQLLLVEEYPSTFSRTSSTLQAFRSNLAQFAASTVPHDHTPTLLVLIISETLLSTTTAAADSFTAHRLLGPELTTHPYVNIIEFNPIAPTLLTKALETIVIKEARKSGRRRTPGPAVLKHLAESGDIRSAVSSLEFICLRGDEENLWSSKVNFTKPKRATTAAALTEAEEEALRLVGNRENQLGIFHSVGKVVYNKRDAAANGVPVSQPPPWFPQHRRTGIPQVDADLLLNELGTDVATFVAALHENYAYSCAGNSAEDTVTSLEGCIGVLSDADLLSVDRFSYGTRAFSGSGSDGLRQDEMSFQVAARGLLFNLPSPVHRSAMGGGKGQDAHRMFFPSSLKLWKQREENEDLLAWLSRQLQSKTIDATIKPSLSRDGVQSAGVDTWRQQRAHEESTDTAADEDSSVISRGLHAPKIEILLDCLPYIACISETSRDIPASFLRSVRQISRLTGAASPEMLDDDTAFELTDQTAEGWSTDHPDGDADGARRPRPGESQARSKLAEDEGLALPIERDVETLVLEDDDIVDD